MKTFLQISALVVSLALTACGGGSEFGDKNAEGNVATSATITAGSGVMATGISATIVSNVETPAATVSSPSTAASASTSLAAPATSGQLIIEASRVGLPLHLLNEEVRTAVDKLDTNTAAPLQWAATFKKASARGGRDYAVVTFTVSTKLASQASYRGMGASLPPNAADELSEIEHKKARCFGRDTYKHDEYYKIADAYHAATEALAVGLPAGTPTEQIYERLDQLRREEEAMSPEQGTQRYEARIAFRGQRSTDLDQCSANT